jgi:hypothetical protein
MNASSSEEKQLVPGTLCVVSTHFLYINEDDNDVRKVPCAANSVFFIVSKLSKSGWYQLSGPVIGCMGIGCIDEL